MNTVPVIFEYKGEMYYGFFESVGGGGSVQGDSWKLTIDNYYREVSHLL